MVGFTVSLRRALLVCFVVMAFVLTVLYWNQGSARAPLPLVDTFDRASQSSSSLSLRNKFMDLVPDIFLAPTEKTWTYKCINDRCIRQSFLHQKRSDRRVPFMTCSMTCGPPNIWPLPTLKIALGREPLSIRADRMQLNVKSPHEDVTKLLRKAFGVFRDELQKLEPSSGKTATSDVKNLHVETFVTHSADTYLTLDTNETYNLTLNHKGDDVVVKIVANSFFGARHGLATLQQLIWHDDEENVLKILNKALIDDVPRFRYRGLMLDTSRHYFSVESIKRTLVGMAHSKLNRFHWHITDSQSFPFVSRFYPELAAYGAYSSAEVYTADDVRTIAEFARVRGIQIVPEIDAPAHAGNGWQFGPAKGLGQLSLCINQQPWSFYCGEPPCGQLNPKNNNTFLVLERLYQELIELTGPTDYFHLGGDEVNLECWAQHFNDTDLRQLWCDFMLKAFARLKRANNEFPPRFTTVWSSGLTSYACLPKHVFGVQVWGASNWQENYQLLEAGYHLVFSHVDAWYLDCGFGSWRSTGEGACSPYRTWQHVYRHRPWELMRLTKEQMPLVLGGESCLWTEQVDETALDNRLWPRAAALGERLWSDPPIEHDVESVPRDAFARMSVLRSRLVALGIKAEPIFPKYCAQNQDECI